MQKIGPFSLSNCHPKEYNVIHWLHTVKLERSARTFVEPRLQVLSCHSQPIWQRGSQDKKGEGQGKADSLHPGLGMGTGSSPGGGGDCPSPTTVQIAWRGIWGGWVFSALQYGFVAWCIKMQLGAERELLPFSRERWHFYIGNPKCFAILVLLTKRLSLATTHFWPKGWFFYLCFA